MADEKITEVAETNADGVEVFNPNIDGWSKPFLRSVVSAENGIGSTSRVGTISIIWATLIYLGYLIFINRAIPANIMSLAYFSALMICVVYSPAKIVGVLKSYFAKKSN